MYGRTVRAELDRLDRLCSKYEGKSVSSRRPSKQALLRLDDDDFALIEPVGVAPVGLAAVAVAAGMRPLTPGMADAQPLSRRGFMGRAAILGGGAVAGVLLTGEQQQAEASFWGFVAKQAFGAVIGWFVNKVLDTAWNRIPQRSFTVVANPRPTQNVFHNSFATPYVINTNAYHVRPVMLKAYGARVGMNQYLRDYDMNYPEAAQVKREVEGQVFDKPIVPTTMRYKPAIKHERVVRKAADRYELKPGDYKADFVNVYTDNKTKEHYCVGVTIGKKKRFLVLDEE
jgi:hypothetical protein